MMLRAHAHVRAFLDAASPLLLGDEARHNLIFGICSTLVEAPDAYPAFHLWTVQSSGDVVWAGVMTPPVNIVVARPMQAGITGFAAEALHSEGVSPPGVTGALPEVDDFADGWERHSGRDYCFLYTDLANPTPTASTMRSATNASATPPTTPSTSHLHRKTPAGV